MALARLPPNRPRSSSVHHQNAQTDLPLSAGSTYSPPAASSPPPLNELESIAKPTPLDESVPSSPSPRGSFVGGPKALRDSFQSSQSSVPIAHPPPAHCTDPEKQESSPPVRSHSSRYHGHDESGRDYEDDDEDDRRELKQKALRILIYLSGPCSIVSSLILLYTISALIFTILIQPWHWLSKKKSFSEQLTDLLAPPLRLQLYLIYSSVAQDSYGSYSPPLLVVINVLSPLVSGGVALSAWTAAVFWCYAAVLGDPEGSDAPGDELGKEYNDGKTSVLVVRAWWKRWLTKALK